MSTQPIPMQSAQSFIDQYVGNESTPSRSQFNATQFEKQCMALFAEKADGLLFPELRRNAVDAFVGLGLPTTKQEAWKYTPIGKWLKNIFLFSPSSEPVSTEQLSAFEIPDLDAYRVVLVNGHFQSELSQLEGLPQGVVIISLKEAISLELESIRTHFGKIATFQTDMFAALNTAMVEDGVFMQISKGKMLDKPLHFINLVSVPTDSFVQTRFLCVAEAGSSAQIIESRVSLNDSASFTNVVGEFSVGEKANVQYHLIQDAGQAASQINYSQVVQAQNSVFTTTTMTLSGNLVRNNAHFLPNAEYCETNLFSALVGNGQMHVDNATFVDHALPNCESNELYKHVLSDQAVGVFNGKIMVRQDAQKTNAYQSNKTILVSDGAKIYTKPELEIYADDVKCSHGAATGKLDESAMFYLRARGLNEQAAKRLLLLAFLGEVVEKIGNIPLRNYVSDKIAARLG